MKKMPTIFACILCLPYTFLIYGDIFNLIHKIKRDRAFFAKILSGNKLYKNVKKNHRTYILYLSFYLFLFAKYMHDKNGLVNLAIKVMLKIKSDGISYIFYTIKVKAEQNYIINCNKNYKIFIYIKNDVSNTLIKLLKVLPQTDCKIFTYISNKDINKKTVNLLKKYNVHILYGKKQNHNIDEYLSLNTNLFDVCIIHFNDCKMLNNNSIFLKSKLLKKICIYDNLINMKNEHIYILEKFDYIIHENASDICINHDHILNKCTCIDNINNLSDIICFISSIGIYPMNLEQYDFKLEKFKNVENENKMLSICICSNRNSEITKSLLYLVLLQCSKASLNCEIILWGNYLPTWTNEIKIPWKYISNSNHISLDLFQSIEHECKGDYILITQSTGVIFYGINECINILKNSCNIGFCSGRFVTKTGLLYSAGAYNNKENIILIGNKESYNSLFYKITRSIPLISADFFIFKKNNNIFSHNNDEIVFIDKDSGYLGFKNDSRFISVLCADAEYFIPEDIDECDNIDEIHSEKELYWIANQDRYIPSISNYNNKNKINILYYSPYPSHPASHGNRSTIQHFGKIFQSKGCKVHFALLELDEYSSTDLHDMDDAWDSFTILPYPFLDYSSLGIDIPFDAWYTHGLGEHIALLCQMYNIDLIFCSYVFQSKILEYVPRHIVRVIDTHDRMSGRYAAQIARGMKTEFFSCTAEDEGRYLRRADIVVARREEEARLFNEESGQDTAIVIPHVEQPHAAVRTFAALHTVGIVASANKINLDLVADFIAALAKRTGDRPPFSVWVAGQVSEMVPNLPPEQRRFFNAPWLTMLGFVEDIGQFYTSVDCIVSPVTYGTGINVKTVQAMCYGMPLVSTSCGTKGIETENPMHNHVSQDEVITSLLHLSEHPELLDDLAACSCRRYAAFYAESLKGFDTLLAYCADKRSRIQQ